MTKILILAIILIGAIFLIPMLGKIKLGGGSFITGALTQTIK